MRRDTEYLSVFSPNAGKCRLGKLRIRTLFILWMFSIIFCRITLSISTIATICEMMRLTFYATITLIKISYLGCFFNKNNSHLLQRTGHQLHDLEQWDEIRLSKLSCFIKIIKVIDFQKLVKAKLSTIIFAEILEKKL